MKLKNILLESVYIDQQQLLKNLYKAGNDLNIEIVEIGKKSPGPNKIVYQLRMPEAKAPIIIVSSGEYGNNTAKIRIGIQNRGWFVLGGDDEDPKSFPTVENVKRILQKAYEKWKNASGGRSKPGKITKDF